MINQTLAEYRITAKLGQGGMGEVYRATDTTLEREVAIKILPESFAGDRNHVARSEREAIGNEYYDELLPIAGPDTIHWSQQLARKEGILTGIFADATFGVAMQLAEKAEPGSVLLCMLPDTGERYLFSFLFEGIAEDMTEEEIELSRSTEGYQMATV